MPDWKAVVRERVRLLRLCPPEIAEDFTSEWASHLEDAYDEFIRDGMPSDEAFRRCLAQIENNRGIRVTCGILREVLMTGFTRKVALPGLLTFASAMAAAWVLDAARIQPKTIFLANSLFLSVPIVWLCLLPLCGAAGALLAHRNGGSRVQCWTPSLFPPAILGVVLVIIAVAGGLISLVVPHYNWNCIVVVPSLALWLVGYAGLQVIPLLLGAMAGEKLGSLRKRTA
jgi:hypothetical protein